MNAYFQSLRQTGRTTRMIEAALKAAVEDRRAVYIYTTASQVDYIKQMLGPEPRHGIKVEIFTSTARNLDPRTMQMRGAHPNCLALVDHAAIELQFGSLLEMVHRFDLPTEWQPIETAPKDGTPVSVYGISGGEIGGIDEEPCEGIAFYQPGGDYPGFDWVGKNTNAYGVWWKPTHWKPLSQPPPP